MIALLQVMPFHPRAIFVGCIFRAEADEYSGVKAITFPVRSRSVLGFGRKGDRNPGTAVEKSVATLDTKSRYLASERSWRCQQKECP